MFDHLTYDPEDFYGEQERLKSTREAKKYLKKQIEQTLHRHTAATNVEAAFAADKIVEAIERLIDSMA